VKQRVIVLDTSMLTVHLQLPGHDSCGTDADRWTYARIDGHLKLRRKQGALFVLPLATIIETARHIAYAPQARHELATELGKRVRQSVDGTTPWVQFREQASLWESKGLSSLMDRWPDLAARKISLADASISDVAHFFAKLGHPVEILTGDAGLKALEPIPPRLTPRRRS